MDHDRAWPRGPGGGGGSGQGGGGREAAGGGGGGRAAGKNEANKIRKIHLFFTFFIVFSFRRLPSSCCPPGPT